jgi:DNA-binding MarR family transcriptional regulator
MPLSRRPHQAPRARRDVGTVGEAIRQTKPFRSDSHEALLTLWMTSEKLHRSHHELFTEYDLTSQQFNVLRILRGSGKAGLPTLEIAERMVERAPGITRLLDRIERKGLVERRRSPEDRRQVMCVITRAGLALLKRLDGPIDELDSKALAPLTGAEIRTLIRLLDKVRTRA